MKVFNKEVTNCEECVYNQESYESIYYSSYFCNYINDNIDNYILADKIHKDCPFNKSLIKEDFESFGFTEAESGTFWDKYINEYETYSIHYNENNVQIKDLYGENVFMFNVTSKPHLEFILQSLNII